MAVNVTFAIDEDLLEKITALAKDMERSLDEVIVFALQDFHEEQRSFVDDILEADRDAAEGRVYTDEEVGEWVHSLGTEKPLIAPHLRTLARAS